MKYIIIILSLLITAKSLSQDSIFRYEQRALTGKILHVDTHGIIYNNQNNYLKDIPIDFVYGYKRDGRVSILYQEKSGPLSAIHMHDYVMGRNLGYKHHYNSFPFAVGFFSSYLYTYRNTRGLTRNPKFSSLIFTAIPPTLFSYIRPKANPKWTYEKQEGYRRARSESNQKASFRGSILGTAIMYIFFFSRN